MSGSEHGLDSSLHALADCRPLRRYHLELVDDLDGLLDVEGQRFEGGVDVDVALLRDLVLRDDVQVREALVQEGRHVIRLLQDLRVDVVVDEGEQLLEDPLNVLDLVQV